LEKRRVAAASAFERATTPIGKMQMRRDAAQNALRFFKEIKSVRSWNNPFDFTTAEEREIGERYRTDSPASVMQGFENAARTGLGNCEEKGAICYAALANNPMLLGNSSVWACGQNGNFNHAFVLVTDVRPENAFQNPTLINDLDKTVMVCDGWTEDWYFPNLDPFTAVANGLANIANPRQMYVRNQLKANPFQSGNFILFYEGVRWTNNRFVEFDGKVIAPDRYGNVGNSSIRSGVHARPAPGLSDPYYDGVHARPTPGLSDPYGSLGSSSISIPKKPNQGTP
jgi:hypothetical protein